MKLTTSPDAEPAYRNRHRVGALPVDGRNVTRAFAEPDGRYEINVADVGARTVLYLAATAVFGLRHPFRFYRRRSIAVESEPSSRNSRVLKSKSRRVEVHGNGHIGRRRRTHSYRGRAQSSSVAHPHGVPSARCPRGIWKSAADRTTTAIWPAMNRGLRWRARHWASYSS